MKSVRMKQIGLFESSVVSFLPTNCPQFYVFTSLHRLFLVKMGERKVLNNYIPPDFDPSIIPKFKRSKDRIQEIRMMLPFSMQCNTCGEYLYKGKKFNSKKEDCKGEDYMGIRRFRFYIKCSVCSAEIAFKTDPKNSDYECESGATRNFEVWRDAEQAKEEVAKEREEEDEHDTMKALENRTLDSKLEMDVLDALDEIKAINQRHERVDTNKVLASLQKNSSAESSSAPKDGLTAADEDLIKSIKFKNKPAIVISLDDPEGESTLNSRSGAQSGWEASQSANSNVAALLQKQLQQQKAIVAAKPVVVVRKRKVDAISTTDTTTTSSTAVVKEAASAAAPAAAPKPAAPVVNSMFGDYGEDSD